MDEVQSQPPTRIGGFAVTRRLAANGQREMYLAESAEHSRVAIEILAQGPSADPVARRRFAEAVAGARHVGGPGVPEIVAWDSDDERPWVATAYPHGVTLADRVAADGPMPTADVLDVAADVATALAALHSVGIVHGELDPNRVVLTGDGARITDLGTRAAFGRARAGGQAPNGPGSGYRAPEQIRRGWVGSPADVFALGAIAFFAATGRPPFGSGDAADVDAAVIGTEPDLTDLADPRLRGLVWDCLGKDQTGRPTAAEAASFARPGGGIPGARVGRDVGTAAAVAATSTALEPAAATASAAGDPAAGDPAAATSNAGPTKDPAANGEALTPFGQPPAVGAPSKGSSKAAGAGTAGAGSARVAARRVVPVLLAGALLAELAWAFWPSADHGWVPWTVDPSPTTPVQAPQVAASAAAPKADRAAPVSQGRTTATGPGDRAPGPTDTPVPIVAVPGVPVPVPVPSSSVLQLVARPVPPTSAAQPQPPTSTPDRARTPAPAAWTPPWTATPRPNSDRFSPTAAPRPSSPQSSWTLERRTARPTTASRSSWPPPSAGPATSPSASSANRNDRQRPAARTNEGRSRAVQQRERPRREQGLSGDREEREQQRREQQLNRGKQQRDRQQRDRQARDRRLDRDRQQRDRQARDRQPDRGAR